MARRIDAFLIEREQSVLQKLVAIGGAVGAGELRGAGQGARRLAPTRCCAALASDEITVIRAVHYHQYDTYFFFDDPAQGRLRYREDEFLDEQDNVVERARAADADRSVARGGVRVGAAVPLALLRARRRTRRASTASTSSRPREREVEKDRRRWLVAFRGVQFYVHLDRLLNPHADGYFVEVKSRTWSRRDAQDKAAIITELLERLGARPDDTIEEDYVEWSGVT